MPEERCTVCGEDPHWHDVKKHESAIREEAARGRLFQQGEFPLHSGGVSPFKIDCDALVPADWEAIAAWVAPTLEPFGDAIGVPTGGHAFARALRPYVTSGPSLIVDDVLTTGASMEQHRTADDQRGLVLFARGPLPAWVRAVFSAEAARGRREAEDERDRWRTVAEAQFAALKASPCEFGGYAGCYKRDPETQEAIGRVCRRCRLIVEYVALTATQTAEETGA